MALDNVPRVDVTLNDKGLQLSGAASTAPKVTILGTTDNTTTNTAGEVAVQVREPFQIVQSNQNERFFNNTNNKPSELMRLGSEVRMGGGTNIEYMPISKAVAMTVKSVAADDTEIPVHHAYTGATEITELDSIPTGIDFTGAAIAKMDDGTMYFFGGYDGSSASDKIYKFDPSTEAVTEIAGETLASARGYAAAIVVSTDIYIIGGTSDGTTPVIIENIDKFDTTTETVGDTYTWESPRFGHCGFSDSSGNIYVAGGTDTLTQSEATLTFADLGDIDDNDKFVVYDAVNDESFGIYLDTAGDGGPAVPAEDHAIVVDLSGVIAPDDLAEDIRDLVQTDLLADPDFTAVFTPTTDGTDAIKVTTNFYGTQTVTTTENEVVESAGADLNITQFTGGTDGVTDVIEYEDPAPWSDGDAVELLDTTVTLNTGVTNAACITNLGDAYTVVYSGHDGSALTSDISIIDFSAETTSITCDAYTGATPATALQDAGAALIAGDMFVFGGVSTGDLAAVNQFDISAETISSTTAFSSAIGECLAGEANSALYVFTGDTAYKYDIGVGYLETIGFAKSTGAPGGEEYAMLEEERLEVTDFGVTKYAGRIYDTFVVTRASGGTTAAAHPLAGVDIYQDVNTLYNQIDEALQILEFADTNIIVFPERAYANHKLLDTDKNFAHLLARFCYDKTKNDNSTIGCIGVGKSFGSDRFGEVSIADTAIWADELVNFSTTNADGDEIWKIGDGSTDVDGDGVPDNFAFWATDNNTIPAGYPPALDEDVVVDNKGNYVDIGKLIQVVTIEGISISNSVQRLYPERGYMNINAAALYAGLIASLDSQRGTTNQVLNGITPIRKLTGTQADALIGARYVTALSKARGYVVAKGVTFAHNISENYKSDYTELSMIRIAFEAIETVRDAAEDYIGMQNSSATRASLQLDIQQELKALKDAGKFAQSEFLIEANTAILGQADISLTLYPFGELTKITLDFSLSRQ